MYLKLLSACIKFYSNPVYPSFLCNQITICVYTSRFMNE